MLQTGIGPALYEAHLYHMSKAADKAGDKGILPKLLMASEVLPSSFPEPQQQHKTLHRGYCPGVFIMQHKTFPASFSLQTLGEVTQCAFSKALSSFSLQSNPLLPSSIKFFPLCKYAGTSWHNYVQLHGDPDQGTDPS